MRLLTVCVLVLIFTSVAASQCIAKPDPKSNPELKKLCDDDQKARTGIDFRKVDWVIVGKQDEERRSSVRKIIDADQLHTADDYFEAALVFQHGLKPEDFLLAHTLAVIATAKGHSEGTSLAAKSLDRYLQSVKQPQIYGTQFSSSKINLPVTQEPFNLSLITDALRKQLQVRSLAEQRKQMQELNRTAGD